ncbi:MAG: hypothetical protein CMLOHMNK_01366 [Steroidobacteraceae bacterium]|nr:hypothetical protein [Steroidobacteraceae bacterium]
MKLRLTGCLIMMFALLAFDAANANAASPGYRVNRTISTEGAPETLSLAVDSAARRLYSARDGGVDVYDLETGRRLASVATTGVPGAIEIAPEIRRGYVSNRDAGTVTLFDLQSLQVVATVRSGGLEPREVEFDATTRRIYVSNAGSGDLVAFDAISGSKRGAVKLGGRLRQASVDGRGHLFVADEAANVLHVIELGAKHEMNPVGAISVWPGAGPTAIAHDTRERRLYVACSNGRMIIVDPDPGQMIGVVPVGGQGESGLAMQFAPARLVMLYMPNASGALNVIQNAKLTASLMESPDVGSRGVAAAFDDRTQQLYLAGNGGLLGVGK